MTGISLRFNPGDPCRRGSVLLVVLVITVLLTLAVYTFSELSLAEAEATRMYGRGMQSRVFAESGIEMALAVLGDETEEADDNFYHRPDAFYGLLMVDSEAPQARGRFSVIAPVENDASGTRLRHGLIDESGKLNLNAVVGWGLEEQAAREVLLELPEMTVDTADAILDWIDEDGESRQYGCEGDYYDGLPLPYWAANAALESLDELLLVRDVTAELLFGEDLNRNGLLDPGEDNGDGKLNSGWSTYLTVYSRESNLRKDGTPRINLNHENLPELYDQLEQEYDEETARFVAAYRMKGARQSQDTSEGSGSRNALQSTGGVSQSSQEGQPAESDAGGQQPQGGEQSGDGEQQRSESRESGENQEKVIRGGMELSTQGSVNVNSVYDLIGIEAEATINGTRAVLQSPWSSDAAELQGYLPDLLDSVSTTNAEIIEGRVNVNLAQLEVLLGIPEMTDDVAQSIAGSQKIGANGEPLTDVLNLRATPGWLLLEGLVDLEAMRKIDKFITTRGDVYGVRSIGYFDAGGPVSYLEGVIDATKTPPKLRSLRDLSELGGGYRAVQLLTP